MELEELIVEIVIGLFLLFTSYQIGIKENITLLHGYHYTQLDPKDKKVYPKKLYGTDFFFSYPEYLSVQSGENVKAA